MASRSFFTAAALVAAFVFLAALPAQAECAPGAPPDDPDCRLAPHQSQQVNPAAVAGEGATDEVSPSGSPSSASVSDMPFVSAGSLQSSTDSSPDLPEASGQGPEASDSALNAPSASLDIRMRYQSSNPSDVSCGVLALGMALDGLDGNGPASSALIDFLEQRGLLYEWGTGVEELAYAAAEFGYGGARPFHGASFEALRASLAAGRPVVVALGANPSTALRTGGEGVPGHFVTVTGISADGQVVSYNDPLLGKRTVHRSVFEALWALQGRSGVGFAAEAGASGSNGDALPWLAFAAGLMAVISATPLAAMRKGIGGRLNGGGAAVNLNARPPHPAPDGKRWKANVVPVTETRTVQVGWKTVTERVPVTVRRKVQVGTRTIRQKVPRYRTVRVRDGYRYKPVQVPQYRTVRYVKGYRTTFRRVPTRYGYTWARRRVPIYGSCRVRVGTRTEYRRIPRYTTKQVQDGFRIEEITVPRYEMREVTIGWEQKQKRVPRMATEKIKVGSKVEWELVSAKSSNGSSGSSGSGKVPGLAKLDQLEGEPPQDPAGDEGDEEPVDPWQLWAENYADTVAGNVKDGTQSNDDIRVLSDYMWDEVADLELYWNALTDDYSISLMKEADGLPDVAITLPVIRGFGREVPVPPLRYVIDSDQALRGIGHVVGDASLAFTVGIGLGLTMLPEQVRNMQTGAAPANYIADGMIDATGFGLGEVAGWGAVKASAASGGGALAAKLAADAAVSVFWNQRIDEVNGRQRLTGAIQDVAEAIDDQIEAQATEAVNAREEIPEIATPPLGTATPSPTIQPDNGNLDNGLQDTPDASTEREPIPERAPRPSDD